MPGESGFDRYNHGTEKGPVNTGFTTSPDTGLERERVEIMDIGKLSMFANMKEKMDWLNQRQQVIARNIANSDTPGYRPEDLKEFNPAKVGGDRQFILAMAKTAPGHSTGLHKPQNFKAEEVRKNYEVSPDKNAVILEEQLVKMNENRVDYQTMTRLYAKQSEMMKTAIGRS